MVAVVVCSVTMTATIGLHGRSGRSAWQLAHSHACWPFRRCACLNDRSCAPLVPGTSSEGPLNRPVSRPRGTKIRGSQLESEAQPLAVLIASDSYQRLLKIGTVQQRLPLYPVCAHHVGRVGDDDGDVSRDFPLDALCSVEFETVLLRQHGAQFHQVECRSQQVVITVEQGLCVRCCLRFVSNNGDEHVRVQKQPHTSSRISRTSATESTDRSSANPRNRSPRGRSSDSASPVSTNSRMSSA